ncbi:hypothetical protein RUM44_000594 [Polyplax serrata]|uniref:Uncharacterized protein n=1 Tax=Polyplax serrata TaxID=468196 RepID=A0ABR1B5W2_POLSC
MSVLDEDFYDSISQKYQRNENLRWLLIIVNVTIFCGWIIGACGLSIAWLVLLIAVTIAIWFSNLIHAVESAKNDEIMRVRRRKALCKDETAEWLNFLFNRWWVLSSNSIFQLLRERFEPLLNDAKPAFVESVELHQFTFGDQTPCVKSVKTYDVVDGKRTPYSGRNSCFARGSQYQIALMMDLYLNSEEFRLVLRTRLFGKGVGMHLDVAMEKLNVCGKLEVLLTVDMEASFPHVTEVSVMFIEKPEVWFSIRMLKALQMMEVPVLKTWIHSVFMDALETALVDPGRLHINVSGNKMNPGVNNWVASAQGVLSISVSTSQLGPGNGDSNWIVFKMGNQYYRSTPLSQNWNDTPSFLVESLQTDKLVIKIKSKRLVSTVTIAQYEMFLNDYNLDNAHSVETLLQKKSTKGSNIPTIKVRLEYTPLPPVSLDQPQLLNLNACYQDINTGVITVFIHSAQGLIYSDPSRSNSYCMLFNDRRKVLTTHCIYNSTSPQWQSRCQFMVNDYTHTSLSFVVCCSWNPKKMSNDEMLGVAVFSFAEGESWVQNRTLPMCGSAYCTPTINISIVFQPVCGMNSGYRERSSSPSTDLESKSDNSNGKTKKSYSSLVQQAKHLLGRGEQDSPSGMSIGQILASGLGLMEISLMQARDLVPMDKNGFSDPYCELKVNGECKYKTTIKKKTLHPVWEENTIIGMPRPGETFDVFVWDHDIVGKNDFLGSIAFTPDEIRQMSSLDLPKWFDLQGVRSGSIELKIRIISEELATDMGEKKPVRKNSTEMSPILRRPSMERSHIRLGIHVPPPTPPRTVSVPHHKNVTQTLVEQVNRNITNGMPKFICENSDTSSYSSLASLPRVTVTENSPSVTRTSSRASSHAPTDISLNETSPPQPVSRKYFDMEMSTFKSMKEKVSKSLRLRRFKSEVNVRHENKHLKRFKDRDNVDFLQREALGHAVSQPNIRNGKNQAIRPTELNISPMDRPDKYSGVEGKVIQAQGLHVAHVAQLYCRIKLIGAQTNEKGGKSGQNLNGKTLSKSHLLPAMPNPQFDLPFQISSPESVPRQAVLLFEIRSSGKEIVAVRKVSLQDLLGGTLPAEGRETHTWLALSNGATLEITIAHGRELKKQTKKLFRSWSVHRIGKI